MLDRWLALGLDARRVTILDPFIDAERRAALETAGATIAADARKRRRPSKTMSSKPSSSR